MNLPIEWTKHLINDKEAKDKLELTIRNSVTTLTRLLEILEEKKGILDKNELSIQMYEHPSWSHKQAHINGKRAALEEIQNLLQFINQG